MTNYVFDPERFTAFEGKTGPYLLYAAVRIKSILRRAEEQGAAPGAMTVEAEAERQLVLALDSFGRAAAASAEKYAPHILCEHLFRLAQSFSKFYTDCPIMVDGTDEAVRGSRLALAEMTLRQLDMGLGLIGIEAPDRM